MNCRNCGAAMRAVVERNYIYCDYCCTFCFPGDLEDSLDRVKRFPGIDPAACPVCALSLFQGTVEGVEVRYCEKCRGIFLPAGAFSEIIMKRRSSYRGPENVVPLNTDELKRRILCPSCKKQMDVHPYYGPGTVVIDFCHPCKMIWVDHGEIAAIERAPGKR
ncbi:MAG: zf-TFIIB domain-containing protein [Gemmataceae bacterium]